MKEIEDIILAYQAAQKAGKKTALATVVHVQGSSYRRPGARMLVTDDGELTGAISGGCLEGDALRKALLAISQQQNKLVTYDTMDEDDHSLGIQLGCNGIVHILFEPIDPSNEQHPIVLLEKAAAQKNESVLVTLFSLDNPTGEQPGTCLLATADGRVGSISVSPLTLVIEDDIAAVFNNKQSLIKKYSLSSNEILTGFVELIKPPASIIIAGAGNDASPLAEMAAVLGWHVTVTDGRKTHANAQRFPKAVNIVVGKPAAIVSDLNINEQSIVVLMSHNYNYDLDMLRQLLPQPCRYIGVLGPKKKLHKMLNELAEEGIDISEAVNKKIYGPVGLDIGAETAEEIALSIIAEIKAVLADKDGGSLRNKTGYIHDHIPLVITANAATTAAQKLLP